MITTDVYLSHYGIKGQKWGVRKYQYKDGSLTPEGRKRYGIFGATKAYADRNRSSKKQYRSDLKKGMSDRYNRMEKFSNSSKGKQIKLASRYGVNSLMNMSMGAVLGDFVGKQAGKAAIKLALRKTPNVVISEEEIEGILAVARDSGLYIGAAIGAGVTGYREYKRATSKSR